MSNLSGNLPSNCGNDGRGLTQFRGFQTRTPDLKTETIANDPHSVNGLVSYDYNPVGNRLSRTSTVTSVSSQNSTYDTNDRLGLDSYDANGNTTSANSNSYGYDFENRLTSLNNGAATFVYDGDGNRVSNENFHVKLTP